MERDVDDMQSSTETCRRSVVEWPWVIYDNSIWFFSSLKSLILEEQRAAWIISPRMGFEGWIIGEKN
jgi:hypothetical protein